MDIAPRTAPTMYFIGVTTGQSSINKIFPRWVDILGLDAELVGFDVPPGAPPETYRAIVRHIKTDPLVAGALVTTHKIDLLAACRDLFDDLDENAALCDEVSCIFKRDGRLIGAAVDPDTSRLAWQSFVPPRHWADSGGQVLCLGGGGAASALSLAVAVMADRPEKFILVERDPARLDRIHRLLAHLTTGIAFEFIHSDSPAQNDALLAALPPGSLVINATGMGKDRPGSPLTDAAVFPQVGLVWELNYRGQLDFWRQARRQAAARHLTLEDGWILFLHGWSQVIAQVFHLQLTPELFNRLGAAAAEFRGVPEIYGGQGGAGVSPRFPKILNAPEFRA